MKKSLNDIDIGKNCEITVKSWKQQYNLEEEEEMVDKTKNNSRGGTIIKNQRQF